MTWLQTQTGLLGRILQWTEKNQHAWLLKRNDTVAQTPWMTFTVHSTKNSKRTGSQIYLFFFLLKIHLSPNNGHGRRVLLCWGSDWFRIGEGGGTRHLTSSLGAAHARLQAVLVAGSALEGFEGIRKAIAEHRHLTAMAHRARNEGEASTGLAQLRVLDPLEWWKVGSLNPLSNLHGNDCWV